VTKFIWEHVGKEGFWALLTPDLYDKVRPMPGAPEGVERLREAGHRIVFKTAANRKHAGRKLTWLMEHSFLPEDPFWSEDYIEAKDVSLLRGDVLVTDNPHEVEKFDGTAILYDRPWNLSKEWPARAQNWEELVPMIMDLAGKDQKPEGVGRYYAINPLETLPEWDWRQSAEFQPLVNTLERMGNGIRVTYQRPRVIETPMELRVEDGETWRLDEGPDRQFFSTGEGRYRLFDGHWYKREPKPEPMPAWAALPLAADKPPETIMMDGYPYQRSNWGGAYTANLPGEHFRYEDGVIYERVYGPGTEPNAVIEGGALPDVVAKVGDIAPGMIPGIGPDAPATINAQGGRQSALPYRFDLVDPTVMFVLAEILAGGAAKYGKWNWRRIGVNDNLNHALSHIYAYLAGDRQDDHLGHAFCRLHFAKSLESNPDPLGLMTPREPEAK
jgi:5'(3')-deoxyribonucleotidase